MNLIDTNAFVRYLTIPKTETERQFQSLARTLFTGAGTGDNRFTTTPEVVSEVIFVLTTDQFRQSRIDIATNLTAVLTLPTCYMPERDEVVESILLWTTKPRLSYVDVRLLVKAQSKRMMLRTFDTDLAKAAGVQRWDRQSHRE